MAMLHIDRLEARYCLPPSAAGAKARLDRLLRAVLDHGLDAANVCRGVGDEALICLKTLHLPVRLRLDEPDWRLVEIWSQALAQAIEAAIRGQDAAQVARYGSRREALADLAMGVATGDLARAWAWRAARLADIGASGSIHTAARALVGALQREPERIVPVLAIVAARGRLAALASRLEPDLWLGLARAALRAAGADPGALLAPTIAPAVETPRTPLAATIPATLTRSTIGRAVGRDMATAVREPELARILAASALLEAEPLLLRRADAAASVAHAARLLVSGAPAGRPVRLAARRRPEDLPPITWDDPAEAGSAPTSRPRRQEEAAGAPAWAPNIAGRDVPDKVGNAALPGTEDLRQTGASVWGGLLFLLHVVDALDLPAALATGTALPGRPPRWALHQLALALLPVAANDPAALAFAGLRPEDTPPSQNEPPADDAERQALLEWRARIAGTLREDLAWTVEDDTALLQRLCLRRAVILADPGWIEVHLRLREEVDVAVRRAGLDLDPGYVPWLGVVVRFLYG